MQLEIEPQNVIVIYSLIRIAREEGDMEEEKKLLIMILKIDPKNVKAICSLIRIAKKEGDIKEQKRLLKMILEIEPENVIAIDELKKIDRLNMQLETHQKNSSIRITKEEGNIKMERKVAESIKNSILKQEEMKITPIEKARDLIYRSEDVISAAQEIKELIEGEREEDTKFVLTELYAKAGTTDRARKLLTGYKKSLDPNSTKREYIKLVNRAIDLASSKRIQKFEWDEWWEQKRELGSIDGEDVSANGTFGARKDEGR